MSRPKLSLEHAREIRRRHSLGASGKELAIDFGVSEASISRIVLQRAHKEDL